MKKINVMGNLVDIIQVDNTRKLEIFDLLWRIWKYGVSNNLKGKI